jgi:hypothetical protein
MGMSRIVLVVALVAGLTGGAITPQRARASCAFFVVWHDRAYMASGGLGETLPEPGARVRGVVEPGCNDTGGANEHPTPVAARRVNRLSPGTALRVRDSVLVAYGYLPQVADFLTGKTLPSDETRGCTLGGPVRITGRTRVAFGFVSVDVDASTVHLHHLLRGAAQIFVDGSTHIDGLARNGLPYIGIGQLVRVDARFCKVPGSTGPKIVARRIAAAGPIVRPPTAEDVLGADWRGRPDAVSRATRGHALAVAIVVLLAALGIGTALVNHRRRSLPPGTG